MSNEILFKERQRFNQWWIWIIFLGIGGFFLFGLIKQVFLGQQFGDRPIGNTGLFILTGLTLLLPVLFLNFRLDTLVKRDGIYVRFFPFHLTFRHYTWDKINKSYVRQYNPIKEFGGWGLRFAIFGDGRALNVSGNKGLQIEFTDNKKLLIGTNKSDELSETLNKIGQVKQ